MINLALFGQYEEQLRSGDRISIGEASRYPVFHLFIVTISLPRGDSLINYKQMTLEELEREYVSLRQQADAVRSYL